MADGSILIEVRTQAARDELERLLAENRTLRRSAERCVTAWNVVRGGVWDPNGLMDEHVDALRKALGPNVEFSGVPAGHSSDHPAGGTSAGTQG